MRLDKFLSQMKFCTRKQTKAFLKSHKVMINGQQVFEATLSFDPNHEDIYIDDELIFFQDSIHLMLHKPKGYLSANKDEMHRCVVDLIKKPYDRFDFKIAGRLDIDTEGLLLLSTDGSFVHEITHPNAHLSKVYLAILDKEFKHEADLLKGVKILDGRKRFYLAKALDIKTEKQEVTITIDEGKYHQIKRMFSHLDYEVLYLKRLKIGKLELNDLLLGTYKEIRKEDVL